MAESKEMEKAFDSAYERNRPGRNPETPIVDKTRRVPMKKMEKASKHLQSRHGGGTPESVPEFKRGGTKRGSGPARLHKNERIMSRKKRMRGRRGGR